MSERSGVITSLVLRQLDLVRINPCFGWPPWVNSGHLSLGGPLVSLASLLEVKRPKCSSARSTPGPGNASSSHPRAGVLGRQGFSKQHSLLLTFCRLDYLRRQVNYYCSSDQLPRMYVHTYGL